MKKIVIVCPHPKDVAPGQRLKYEQYIESWEKNGFVVDIKPFMTDRFWKIVYKKGHYLEKICWTFYGYLRRLKLLFTLRKYDLSYIFLWVTPFGTTFFERLYCFVSKNVIYDIDDLVRFRAAMADGILPDARPHVLLVLGRYNGNFQSDPAEMKPFIADGLTDMASWSICAFGHREFDVMTDAIANGGHCRVGFENNLYLKDGSLAPSNADLVRQLAETCQPASRAETLALFAL